MVDTGDVAYFQRAELKQVETVTLPKSHLIQLWRRRVIVSQASLAVGPCSCGLPPSQREGLQPVACALHTSGRGFDVCTSSVSP